MTATLAGRIQTRLALLAVVGVLWTLLHVPLLPVPAGTAVIDTYRVGFATLTLVAWLGVAWEGLYHLLQQLRWEKDWPTLLGLLTGIPEGVLVYHLISGDRVWALPTVTPGVFALSFATTWVLVWAVANGPLRIVLVRWRFQGGRLW